MILARTGQEDPYVTVTYTTSGVLHFHLLFIKLFADDADDEREVWKWLSQESKTSVLRVSTHW
jgi:hypothetical protein